jgi:hypothetical protein
MTDLDLFLKIAASIALLGLLTCIGWALTHLRKIRKLAVAHEGLPKDAPKATLLVVLGTVATVLVLLLSYCVIHLK